MSICEFYADKVFMDETFWERLERLVDNSFTRKRFFSVLDLAVNSISTWKARKTFPSVEVMIRIAKALGVTVEYLVTGADSTDPWIRDHRDLLLNLKELNAEDLEEISAIVKIKADRQIARDLQSGLGS